MSFNLVDQNSRDIIKNEIKTNLMVEAGAGSGKTTEMANRIIALVSNGYRTIDQIVAITFTNKAANELRERVRKALEKSYKQTNNPLEKEAYENIHKCFIGTIHSFCGRLLRERPIEAGLDPAFAEIDDYKDSLIRNITWENYIRQADDDLNLVLKELDSLDVPSDIPQKVIKLVCDNADVDYTDTMAGNIRKELENSIDEILPELTELVDEAYKCIPYEVLNGQADSDGKLMDAVISYSNRYHSKKNLSFKDKLNLIFTFRTKNSCNVIQKRWGENKEEKARAKDFSTRFTEFREDNVVKVIDSLSVYIYSGLLIPLAIKAKHEYEAYKQETASVNFHDLLRKSADTLRDYPEVRRYFQSKYKTLLVDEFQDTDPIQAEMIMYLVGRDINEKHWSRLIPNEGSLFVVGDPKQSIYGFRRADLEIYERVKDIIVNNDGKFIELVANFRSVKSLGDWFNTTFSKLINSNMDDEENNIHQVKFSNLQTVRRDADETVSGVYTYTVDAKEKDDVEKEEGIVLSKLINWLVNTQYISVGEIENPEKKKVEYRDIMILTFKKKELQGLAQALAEKRIPVRTVGTDIIKRAPIFDLYANVVKMIAYPEETAYIYRILNSELFSFTDAQLVHFKALGGQIMIYQDIDKLLENENLTQNDIDLLKKIQTCYNVLKELTDLSRTLLPGALSEAIITKLCILGKHLGSEKAIAGLDSFVTLQEKVRLADINDIWNLSAFIDNLIYMVETGEEEELNVDGENQNAIRMMNLHKAKGLEAPIIILAGPASGGSRSPSDYVERTVKDDGTEVYKGYATIKRSTSFADNVYYSHSQWGNVFERAWLKNTLETVRLKYVAATRAKNLLLISNARIVKDDGRIENVGGTWQSLLEHIPTSTDRPFIEQVYDWEDKNQDLSLKYYSIEIDNDIDAELAEINTRRENAINSNEPTFESWQPSDKHGRLKVPDIDVDSDEADEMRKRILRNSITWVLGDELAEETAVQKLQLGTMAHKILETLFKNEALLPATIKNIADRSDIPGIGEKELFNMVESFKKTKLFERVMSSPQRYMEVPFSCKIAAGVEFDGKTTEKDTYAEGYIDLVFQEGDTWTIIDYKTCSASEVKSALEQYYKPQLAIYKEAWERLSGEKVGKTELFFVEKSN